METTARKGDNRKLFRLFHKATITREKVNEMKQNINGASVKGIKDRLIRWKEFFEAGLKHDAPSVVPNITDSPVEPYVRK
ncbi:unnamed protein product [Dracunculus medinensis]|uniref:HTH_48 domain-containing protein n=1 Tax=Dracunculus medinensis TaxID=318479 RepID=A0A0N4UEJ5_DRAME|nr:unnamed protein product [Dracunculus medinensis]